MSRIDKTMAKFLKKKSKRTRLNLEVPEDLLRWTKDYASKNDTTVTQLIVDHLRDLRKSNTEVPQI